MTNGGVTWAFYDGHGHLLKADFWSQGLAMRHG